MTIRHPITACLLALLVLAGCDDAAKRLAQAELKLAAADAQQDKLRIQIDQQKSRIDALDRQLAEINRLPADRWQLLPKAERIELGSLSGIRKGRPQVGVPPTSQSDGPTTRPEAPGSGYFVRLYFQVHDRDGHRVHGAGPIDVSLFELTHSQAKSLGAFHYDATAADKLYRSALTGDFYAVDLPLPRLPTDGVTTRIEFLDYLTGKTLTDQRVFKLD